MSVEAEARLKGRSAICGLARFLDVCSDGTSEHQGRKKQHQRKTVVEEEKKRLKERLYLDN